MDDILGHPKGDLPKYYHKTDWSFEHKKFKESLPGFISAIRVADARTAAGASQCANPQAAPEAQPIEDEPFVLDIDENDQKKEKNMQDIDDLFVESSDAGVSNSENLAILNEPNEPKEPPVSNTDDIFAVSGGDPLKDLFDDDDSSEATEEKPASPKEIRDSADIPEAPIDSEDEDTGEERGHEAGSPQPQQRDVLRGFDQEGFHEALAIADRMLAKVDLTLNFTALAEQLDEYEVKLAIDPRREYIDVLNGTMIQVQAKLDGVNTILKKLMPTASALQDAWEFLEDVGVLYASATNREKRDAQVKMALRERWVQKTEAARVRQSYENRMRELKGQWETLSRLMTFDQYRTQYAKELRRGELPFDPRSQILPENNEPVLPPPQPPAQPKPRIEAPQKEEAPKKESSNIFDQKKSAPLEPQKFVDLDDMPSSSEAEQLAAKKKSNKGFSDWDF